jgi:hypothetical protein
MTAIDDLVANIQRNRTAEGDQPILVDADTLIAAFQALSAGAQGSLLAMSTYTPTLRNSTNVASSFADLAYFFRIGNFCVVFGSCTIDPTAATTPTLLGISLPIPRDIGASGNLLYGLAARNITTIVALNGAIVGNDANNDAQIQFRNDADIAARQWIYIFGYAIP